MNYDEELDLRREKLIRAVIAAAGGRIVGRIRLQKVLYLLDQLGLNSGFTYEYHHYGPYSDELFQAVDFAKAFDLIDERIENRKSDGVRYSIFELKGDISVSPFDDLGMPKIQGALTLMNGVNATVLELAATAHFLERFERRDDWKDEIVRRKGIKTEGGRLDRAIELLKELNLAA